MPEAPTTEIPSHPHQPGQRKEVRNFLAQLGYLRETCRSKDSTIGFSFGIKIFAEYRLVSSCFRWLRYNSLQSLETFTLFWKAGRKTWRPHGFAKVTLTISTVWFPSILLQEIFSNGGEVFTWKVMDAPRMPVSSSIPETPERPERSHPSWVTWQFPSIPFLTFRFQENIF